MHLRMRMRAPACVLAVLAAASAVSGNIPLMVGCISIDGEDYTVYENGYCPGANELGSGDHSGDTACAAAFCTGVSSCAGFEYATNAETPSCYASTSCTATDMVYYDGFNLAVKGCSLPEVQGCLLINGKNYTKISNGGCSGLNELGDGVYGSYSECESAKCSGTQCSSFEIDTVRDIKCPPPSPTLCILERASHTNGITCIHCTGLWTVLCKHRLQRSQRAEPLQRLGPVCVWLRLRSCPPGGVRHSRQQQLH